MQRIVAQYHAQTYTNKELIIFNTDIEYPYVLGVDDPTITVVNNGMDYKSGLAYANRGQICRDAVTHATGEYFMLADDDDIYLPWHMQQAVDGIIVLGTEAWKPAKSMFATAERIDFAANIMEASIIVKMDSIRRIGFNEEVTGCEGLSWYDTLRDAKQLDENNQRFVVSYCFNWGDPPSMKAGHKQSGSIGAENNFENHKRESTDFATGPLMPISHDQLIDVYLPYFLFIAQHKSEFPLDLYNKYVTTKLYSTYTNSKTTTRAPLRFNLFETPLLYHQQTIPSDTVAHIGERTIEIPISNKWLSYYSDTDIVEIGAVIPYYNSHITHEVIDLYDAYDKSIRIDAADASYKNKCVLSISTLEHIGMLDYGNTEFDDEKATLVLKKILTEADNYLISWPIGYNRTLDNTLRNLSHADYNFNIIMLKQINQYNKWQVIDIDWTIQFGTPYQWANGVLFVTSNTEWIAPGADFDLVNSPRVLNITGEQFGGKLKMGDLIAVLNILQYTRNTTGSPLLQFYIPDSELQPGREYVKLFKDYLIANTNYISDTPGDTQYNGYGIEIWSFRKHNGEFVSITNNAEMQNKICIFPLLAADYNYERIWPLTTLQSIIDEYTVGYDNYEKIICTVVEIPPSINLHNFKISTDLIENLNHIQTCKYYIGGDTGLSHFASALNNPKQIKQYYYYSGNHGSWQSDFTSPFYINNTTNFLHYYDTIEYNTKLLKTLITYQPVNNKIRIGTTCDGGYVVVDGYQYDYLISGGAGHDISFEIEFIQKYPNVGGVCFDGTLDAPTHFPAELSFTKKNIGSNETNDTTNLVSYIQDYSNVFCKLDIEGGEWDLFRSAFKYHIPRIKQLVIELHNIFTLSTDCLSAMKLITTTHYLVHVHSNNYCKEFVTINGNTYPDTLEFTFIRKDCDINGYNITSLPIPELDFPNSPFGPDININFYPFNME